MGTMKDWQAIRNIYKTLNEYFGALHWWPGDSPLEIILGAILTQNTNWGNVEKCITRLKDGRLIKLQALRDINQNDLAELIRSSGYYNQKSIKIKAFLYFLDLSYQGSLSAMISESEDKLRPKLLEIKGVGPETADSILLYACRKPVFVVDAYTRRIFSRLRLLKGDEEYEQIRKWFESHISSHAKDYYCDTMKKDAIVRIYNQYHALIVNLGKSFCLARSPRCKECPIKDIISCRV